MYFLIQRLLWTLLPLYTWSVPMESFEGNGSCSWYARPIITPGADSQSGERETVSPTADFPGIPPAVAVNQTLIVTSFEPQATICPIDVSSSFAKQPALQPSQHLSTSASDDSISAGSPMCTVAYARKVASLCNTIITRLGDVALTVTDFEQKITFRTDHGLASLRGRLLGVCHAGRSSKTCWQAIACSGLHSRV